MSGQFRSFLNSGPRCGMAVNVGDRTDVDGVAGSMYHAELANCVVFEVLDLNSAAAYTRCGRGLGS